ncbi:hypothetical protein CVT24_005524 [Panaeolus cyanescens]|uniref:Nucleoporin Nup133/Nup155-like C-terminal domain-containing protein n=1 Tax=Panaeolus cyanescens TaxID=181874 RepID=A0A409YBW3_9AGAR|nr:hypothetical protein CVT24_005524 [Panaeolus cyanescens]
MATFSPSPAPRRSGRLQQNRVASPPSRRPLAPGGSSRALGQSSSYLFNSETNSVASAMDIDERASIFTDRSFSRLHGDAIFAKTDEMNVSFYASLPLEVKQVLRSSDFTRDLYSGEIDTVTSFALVASSQTCFVWQHAQTIKGIPTCYIFPCPPGYQLPFHALVPQSQREPGLILVSSTGLIRFWDSVASGLAGGENFLTSQLEDFEIDESVTNLIRVDAQIYLISTSHGSLYRVSLASTGGKHHLSCRLFARPNPNSSFSRLIPSFLSSGSSSTVYSTKDKRRHIHAISVGLVASNGDRDVWVLANGWLQQWVLKSEGWEQLALDFDLNPFVTEFLEEREDVKRQGYGKGDKGIEVSDLTIFEDGHIAILISYSGEQAFSDVRRSYALLELRAMDTGMSIENFTMVPYQTTNQPGPPVHPRIQHLFSGSIVSVQFGDAVALCARNTDYRDRLELKQGVDRTLGVGVSTATNTLLILTATTMMKVTMDLEKIQNFRADTGRTHLLRSIMMQAILYGSSPVNPLRFSFPPDLNEDALMQAAEGLSTSVLRSDPDVVRQSPDMNAQLTGRKERLSWLIGFINENAVLGKMSQRTRQQIAMDAEKLYAAHQLWLSYNQFLSSPSTSGVLKEAVSAYMTDIHAPVHEDVMRSFFRNMVYDIGKLLKKVNDVVTSAIKKPDVKAAVLLPEAMRILIIVLQCAFQYRAYNLGVYGIDLPMLKPWSSRSYVVDSVLSILDLATKTLDSTSNIGRTAEQKQGDDILTQLPALAAVFFECVKERIASLESEGKEAYGEKEALVQRFSLLRPEILENLRRHGHEQAAFSLAEQYQDFASLVALCHRDKVYPPSSNPNAQRIESYIQRFKDDFTNELFQWYIQHGEVRTMFDPELEAQRGVYLDAFFKAHPNWAISWLNDLGKGRYEDAAMGLFKDASGTGNLEAKHLMLSFGKLSYLAQVQESDVSIEESTLNAFHDELDFISVHEALINEFKSALTSRARQPLDVQLDTIIKSKAKRLPERPAFTHIFKDLLRQLLQGKAVSIEDAVDLLTLKDNDSTPEDYTTALLLITRATNVPDARRISATRTVWRRIYLHDDWESIQKTDGVSDEELISRYQSTALFYTLLSLDLDTIPAVDPSESLVVPTLEEITSRWPGMSGDQVEMLQGDYAWEQDTLGELLLEDIYMRIQELAEQKRMMEGEED